MIRSLEDIVRRYIVGPPPSDVDVDNDKVVEEPLDSSRFTSSSVATCSSTSQSFGSRSWKEIREDAADADRPWAKPPYCLKPGLSSLTLGSRRIPNDPILRVMVNVTYDPHLTSVGVLCQREPRYSHLRYCQSDPGHEKQHRPSHVHGAVRVVLVVLPVHKETECTSGLVSARASIPSTHLGQEGLYSSVFEQAGDKLGRPLHAV